MKEDKPATVDEIVAFAKEFMGEFLAPAEIEITARQAAAELKNSTWPELIYEDILDAEEIE